MAVRRPRIKASANLMSSKRKPKLQSNSSSPPAADNESLYSVKSTEDEAIQEETNLGTEVDRKTKIEVDDATTDSLVSPAETTQENGKENMTYTGDNDGMNNENNIKDLVASVEPKLLLNPKQEHIEAISQEEQINAVKVNAIDNKLENTSFKCPPNVVSFNRSISNTATASYAGASVIGSDDIFHSDLEDVNVIQMDMQKSSSNVNYPTSPMSPSKTLSRQRIRATPIFGQRRNSFVGTSPSPHTGDEGGADFTTAVQHRRERHYSASLSQTSNASSTHHYHTPHKYVPLMHTGRIRTESGCSAFSDSYAASSKSRKNDDHQHHRSLSRRDFEARFSKGVVPDKSMLKMFDLIYYNPLTNPMEQKTNILNMKEETTQADDSKTPEDVKLNPSTTNKNSTDSPAAIPVPQLKLNSNGELILDDKSLEIETTAEKEARKALASSTLIFLDENTGMNGFYRKQKRTKEWQAEETIKFYRCLQTVGTDFSLMSQLFPTRTRRDLKLKFKKEERCNLALINKALLYPKIFNIDELKLQLEAEERERVETEQKWKELKAREAQNFKKAKIKNYPKASAGARAMADGDAIYQNENITKEKLKKRNCKKRTNGMADGDEIYQNENITKEKLGKGSSKKSTKCSQKKCETTPNDNIPITISLMEERKNLTVLPEKKKRKRVPKKPITHNRLQKKQIKIGNICIISSSDDIVHENIKEENHHLPLTAMAQQQFEIKQLEMELDDLLHHNQPAKETISDSNYNNNSNNYYVLDSPIESAHNVEGIESKSLVNLDDGTVTTINDEEMHASSYNAPIDDYTISLQEQELQQEDQEESPKFNSSEMDEGDIQKILTELSEGSMVLVSTLDPNNADKLLNEIYMLDKLTGELCDKPLDIPDAIVQCILTVMS